MAINVKHNVNMNGNYIQNGGLERLNTAPANPKANQTYVDSNDNLIKQYDGTEWVTLCVAGAMVYRGTVGTGGTVTALPDITLATTKNGDTYKVCAEGTYASQHAQIGDLFIAKKDTDTTGSWSYVPSGNDKFVGAITGDATTTSFPITHTLNSQEVTVQIYDNATGQEILADVTRTNATTVTVAFGSAPAATESYKVVILA